MKRFLNDYQDLEVMEVLVDMQICDLYDHLNYDSYPVRFDYMVTFDFEKR